MKFIVLVIDSFGIGELPDANKFGDVGSNTYLNIYKKTNVQLPNLNKLGLSSIDGISGVEKPTKYLGSFGRMQEKTMAKDTTAGHYEMSGIIMKNPYKTFPKAFPKALLDKIKKITGYEFMGNEVASGTEIIQRLGSEHLKIRKPIVYTSADSVFQIACHTDVLTLEKQYALCRQVRKILKGKWLVGRVIARPFAGSAPNFYRTDDRKDFALKPPKKSMMDFLKEKHYDVVGIGKIEDIFEHQGLTKSYHTKTNTTGIKQLLNLLSENINGLIFANLCDTDMLYGHRNDVEGYAKALVEIDNAIPKIIKKLKNDDIFVVTADHGCDPTTPSTDHSREYVPLMIYGKNLKTGINLGTLQGFDNIKKAVLSYFNVKQYNDNFLNKLR